MRIFSDSNIIFIFRNECYLLTHLFFFLTDIKSLKTNMDYVHCFFLQLGRNSFFLGLNIIISTSLLILGIDVIFDASSIFKDWR